MHEENTDDVQKISSKIPNLENNRQQHVLRIRFLSSESIRSCAACPSHHHIRRARARHGTRGNGTWRDGRWSPWPADEDFWGHVWWYAKNGRRGHDGRATRGWVSLLGVPKTSTCKKLTCTSRCYGYSEKKGMATHDWRDWPTHANVVDMAGYGRGRFSACTPTEAHRRIG